MMAIGPTPPSAMAAGIYGVNNALAGLQETAHEIAQLNHTDSNPGGDGHPRDLGDLARSMVDLKIYKRDAQASLEVVQTADEMIGFLLDVRA